ncbi:hypothetical protein [Georgenia sp. SUBG003]|uniref:hypothetical protein n=1 Tax=Georgenia sp. SUBG003 TaxID=1497974 RepID=UPI0004D71B09|nr:hypothetical protein DA06_26635 [Georgenia sp. SUBG003]
MREVMDWSATEATVPEDVGPALIEALLSPDVWVVFAEDVQQSDRANDLYETERFILQTIDKVTARP